MQTSAKIKGVFRNMKKAQLPLATTRGRAAPLKTHHRFTNRLVWCFGINELKSAKRNQKSTKNLHFFD